MATFKTFIKDPDSNLDYTVDWTKWLAKASDTIASVTWVVPDGITQTNMTNTSKTATIWLDSGVLGSSYTVTNRITTLGGRIEDHSFILKLQEK